MLILVHNSPATLAPYRTRNLGVLCSPRRYYGPEVQAWPWAADNDAFSAFDEARYLQMLDAISGRSGCLFVTAPDVVGNARETLQLFESWRDDLHDRELPIALVAQDGLWNDDVPWDQIRALFIGGTTEWKMGEQARALALNAKARGLWVHMGRVNTEQRMRYARWIGCDSVDGTQFSWFRDAKLPAALNALRQEAIA